MHRRKKIIVATVIAGLVWAVAVAGGLQLVLSYEQGAGSTGEIPGAWPRDSAIQRAADRPTLLLFAHPRCPCTHATMGELAQVMAHTQGKLHTCVVFYEPENGGAQWAHSSLEQNAAAIPGVTVVADIGGREAKRFGAETSGHALLFAPNGKLLFSGGITASRGHAGDNAGESALIAIVDGRAAPQTRTRVFGCGFGNAQEVARK